MNHFEIDIRIPRGSFVKFYNNRIEFNGVFTEEDQPGYAPVMQKFYIEGIWPATKMMRLMCLDLDITDQVMVQADYMARVTGRIGAREFLKGEHDPVLENIFIVEHFSAR